MSSSRVVAAVAGSIGWCSWSTKRRSAQSRNEILQECGTTRMPGSFNSLLIVASDTTFPTVDGNA